MKKTNLFKKMTSLFLAIMMLMSVVPMMASAEVSDGKFWLTLGMTTFDDYVEVSRSAGTYVAKKSDNSGWLYQTAGNNKYKDVFASTNSSMRLHHGTGVRAFADTDFYEAAPVIEGAGELTIYGRLNRGWSNSSPSWYAGNGKGSPDSIIMVSDLFDKADVKVGDTVKITAWVNSVYPQSATSSDDNIEGGAGEVPADATATVSMWVADKATDGTVGTAAADYHLTPVTDASWTDAVTHKNLTYGQWQALSLTYTVTDANKGASGIALNSDLLGTTEKVTSFPLELHIAAVKAEKLVKNEGEYTIEDGGEFTVIDTMNMDGFQTTQDDSTDEGASADEYILSGWTYSNKKTLEDGRTQWIRNLSEDGPGISGQRTGISALSGHPASWYGDNINVGLPSFAGTNVLLTGHRWGGSGIPAPYASIRAYNIFDEDDVQVGDTVKVTAWIYTSNIIKWVDEDRVDPSDDAPIDQTSPIDIRMWLSETVVEDEGIENDLLNYSYITPKADGTEQLLTTVVPRNWTPISFTYKVTEDNKNISSIRIDQGAGVNGQRMADWVFLAGIQTEKLTPVETEAAGRIKGTAVAAPATVETGADYRVLVGAYKKVGDVYMMLGCNILPYEADCSYDFVINDAEGATDVFAYLWDFNAYEPQIVPIECTYIAQ